MGRFFAINYLPPEQHAAVEACIRRHRFCGLAAIRAELEEAGIKVSKSGLHRYMQSMRLKEGLYTGVAENTIVTIVERTTGITMTTSTGASAAQVVAVIEGANFSG